jgi:hypothetical protein
MEEFLRTNNLEDCLMTRSLSLGAIKHIIIINNMINFILQPLFVIGFNFHKQVCEIQFDFENNLPCGWVLMCKNELLNKVPFNIHFTGDGNKILGIMQ